MSTPPRVVREETTIEEAARLMLDEGIGCLPVVDADGGMVGIVTESDLTGHRPWLSLRAWAHRKLPTKLAGRAWSRRPPRRAR